MAIDPARMLLALLGMQFDTLKVANCLMEENILNVDEVKEIENQQKDSEQRTKFYEILLEKNDNSIYSFVL